MHVLLENCKQGLHRSMYFLTWIFTLKKNASLPGRWPPQNPSGNRYGYYNMLFGVFTVFLVLYLVEYVRLFFARQFSWLLSMPRILFNWLSNCVLALECCLVWLPLRQIPISSVNFLSVSCPSMYVGIGIFKKKPVQESANRNDVTWTWHECSICLAPGFVSLSQA